MSAMSLFALLILGILAAGPQQGPPADTLPAPAADSQSVSRLPADTRPAPPRTSPGPPVPRLAEPLPQATPPAVDIQRTAPDTLAAVDTLAAGTPPPPDTAAARRPSAPGAILGEVGRDVERELAEFRRSLGAQFDQLRAVFSVSRLLLAVLALVVSYLLIGLVTLLLERLARWRPAHAYRIRRVIPLVKFGLWFAAIWIVVGSLFAGSVLAVGLLVLVMSAAVIVAGFQFVRDLAGGLVLTFEQPFQIGSRVQVGAHVGEVRRIGLRAFELAAPDGGLVVVPNAEVLRRSITSTQPETREAAVTVELAIPEDVDPDTARTLAREAAYASPYLCTARPVTVALAAPMGTSRPLHVRIEAYVFDAAHAEALASDITRLAHGAFGGAASDLPERA